MKAKLAALGNTLLPKTLFGRLMLIFMGGLLALQGFGLAHYLDAREYYLLRGLMSERARLMANTAVALDLADPARRLEIIERMDMKGFAITLHSAMPAMPPQAEEKSQGRPSSYDEESGADQRPSAMLYRALEKNIKDYSWFKFGEIYTQVANVQVPSFWEQMHNSDDDVSRNLESVYQARVALSLSDGSWLLIEDDAANLGRQRGLPLTGLWVGLLVSALLSGSAVYVVVKPFRRLAQAAENFGRNMGTPPLPENGPREVREAAQAFNRMQRRIREFVDERSRTLAALSHDLRTPLTRMRLRAEQVEQPMRAALQKDMNEMQELIDSNIEYAREAGTQEALAPVDIASLLESLTDDRRDMGQNVSIADENKLLLVQPLLARPLSIKRCLNNLVDNAIRYGGMAVLDVEDSPRHLAVTITDKGPGIPPESRELVFRPFYRLEPSRNRSTGGSGLGLTTARNMARLHGGDITLENMPQGGLRVTVTFART